MKKIYKTYNISKELLMVFCAMLIVFGANAQVITVNTAPDDLTDQYLNTDETVDYTVDDPLNFPGGTVFYFHNGAGPTSFDAEDVLGTSTGTGANNDIDFTWSELGTNVPYYISAATGTFGSQWVDIDNTATPIGGSVDVFEYNMNQAGLRRITTPELDLNTTDDLRLLVTLNVTNVDPANPLVVQYSTDGSTFTDLTDDQADDFWDNSFGGTINLVFELGSAVKNFYNLI